MTPLTLLSLSSVFHDFFETPEDDPLLQDDDDMGSDSSDMETEEETPNRGPRPSSEISSPLNQDDPLAEESTDDAEEMNGDGISSEPPHMIHTSADAASANVPANLSEDFMQHLNNADSPGTHSPPPSNQEDTDSPPRRTRKFVVPYNASVEDLKEVNDAIASGWSFQCIAVAKARASVKPEGKKVIITLKLDEPRTLFDF